MPFSKQLSAFAVLLVCGARSAAAHPAWGIVLDPQGRVIFSEVETNRVWRIENGRAVPILQGRHSHEIYIDGKGNLFGEHLEYRPAGERWLLSLWKLTPAGREVQLQPPTNTLELPEGLGPLRDQQGNTYAFRGALEGADELVLYRRSPASQTVAVAGGPPGHADGRGAAARFTGIQGKAFGSDGALYVADGGCVRRITPEGVVTTIGGDPLASVAHGERPRLLGLAVDERGTVFVADYDHRLVREISPDGRLREPWRSGPFWAPTGVAAATGALYILEARPEALEVLPGPFVRVWCLGADGSKTLLATLGERSSLATWVSLAIIGTVAAGLLIRLLRRRPAVAASV